MSSKFLFKCTKKKSYFTIAGNMIIIRVLIFLVKSDYAAIKSFF